MRIIGKKSSHFRFFFFFFFLGCPVSSSSVSFGDQVLGVRARDARLEKVVTQDDNIDYLLNIYESDEDCGRNS